MTWNQSLNSRLKVSGKNGFDFTNSSERTAPLVASFVVKGVFDFTYIVLIYHINWSLIFKLNCPRSEPEVMKRTGSVDPVIDPEKPFFMSSDQIER